MGVVTKFPCGGGEGAVHSNVVASHGLSFTFLPCLMLQKKLMMNGIWARPMIQAAHEIGWFHWNPVSPQIVCSFETVHPCPPSYHRRCIPAIPCRNIGRKITFMQMSVGQKCTLPQKSFIFRPVAFGNQNKRRRKRRRLFQAQRCSGNAR